MIKVKTSSKTGEKQIKLVKSGLYGTFSWTDKKNMAFYISRIFDEFLIQIRYIVFAFGDTDSYEKSR